MESIKNTYVEATQVILRLIRVTWGMHYVIENCKSYLRMPLELMLGEASSLIIPALSAVIIVVSIAEWAGRLSSEIKEIVWNNK